MELASGTEVSLETLQDIADYIVRNAFYIDDFVESINDTRKDLVNETWGPLDQSFTDGEADEIITLLEPLCKCAFDEIDADSINVLKDLDASIERSMSSKEVM